MTLPELFANAFATTLAGAINTAPAALTQETWPFSTAAPSDLQGGQFRIQIDSEIMLVVSGQNTSNWTVIRGYDNTATATHSSGAAVNHYFFAGAAKQFAQKGSDGYVGGTSGTPLTPLAVVAVPTTNTSPSGAHYDLGVAPVPNGGGSPNIALGTSFPHIVPTDVGGLLGSPYNAGTTYNLYDKVTEAGVGYVSTVAGNLGNDPATDGGVHWITQGTGFSNIALGAGWRASAPRDGNLGQVTTGFNNTAMGAGCLISLTTGIETHGYGADCMSFLQGGQHNVAMGSRAMSDATVMNYSTAIGGASLGHSANVNYVTALGYASGQYNAANYNVWIGALAGQNFGGSTGNSATSSNVAIGYGALQSSGTPSANVGTANVAVGHQSGNATTTGSGNVMVGNLALSANTTGSSNTAIGTSALLSSVNGSTNTAVGTQALAFSTATGNAGNVAVGYQAILGAAGTSTATSLTAVGTQALKSVTTGSGSTAVGNNAAGSVVTGGRFTAVGASALFNNVTTSATSANVAVGYQAGLGAVGSTAINMTAIGYQSLLAVTTGAANNGLGVAALGQVTTGSNNTGVGHDAGFNIITGSNVSALGFKAGLSDGTNITTDISNATLIGEQAQSALSNVIVLGKAIATRPNLCFGGFPTGAGFFGNGVGMFYIGNAVTTPTASPTGGGLLYVSAGALRYRGSAGTDVQLAAA